MVPAKRREPKETLAVRLDNATIEKADAVCREIRKINGVAALRSRIIESALQAGLADFARQTDEIVGALEAGRAATAYKVAVSSGRRHGRCPTCRRR